jgi:hypothetical protein
LKSLYQPSAKAVALVDVPTMNYLMIDGEGDPNTRRPTPEAIETLFAVAHRGSSRSGNRRRSTTACCRSRALQADDMTAFTTGDKAKLAVDRDDHAAPSFVTAEIVAAAVADVEKEETRRRSPGCASNP